MKGAAERICGINRKFTAKRMSRLPHVFCNSYQILREIKGPNKMHHLVNVIIVYTDWNGIKNDPYAFFDKMHLPTLDQFLIFKLLIYCFEETVGFDVRPRLQVVHCHV